MIKSSQGDVEKMGRTLTKSPAEKRTIRTKAARQRRDDEVEREAPEGGTSAHRKFARVLDNSSRRRWHAAVRQTRCSFVLVFKHTCLETIGY